MNHPNEMLWTAIEFLHVEAMQRAIKQGADINTRSEKAQQTPLIKVLLTTSIKPENRIKCVELLLKHHADPNLQDKYGKTALHYVATNSNFLDIAKKIIMHGGDPTIKDEKNKDVFDVARPFKEYEQSLKELHVSTQQKELDALVSHKTDPDINIL